MRYLKKVYTHTHTQKKSCILHTVLSDFLQFKKIIASFLCRTCRKMLWEWRSAFISSSQLIHFCFRIARNDTAVKHNPCRAYTQKEDTYMIDNHNPCDDKRGKKIKHIVPKLYSIRCKPKKKRHTRTTESSEMGNQSESFPAEAALPANQIHGLLRIDWKALLITPRLDWNLLRLWTHDLDLSIA